MLENLFDLVKSQAGDAIINNPEIPNEHNDTAVQMASSSIFDTLKGAVNGGNLNDVVAMFTNGANNAGSNPLASIMQNNFVQSLMQKFGLGQGQASNIASSLMPNVLQNLVSKTNDPNDNSFNIQDMISKFTGDNSSVGGFDINSILSQFTGGGNSQQQGGGGIMDTIKGLFGG